MFPKTTYNSRIKVTSEHDYLVLITANVTFQGQGKGTHMVNLLLVISLVFNNAVCFRYIRMS